jgi:hypothetical protein
VHIKHKRKISKDKHCYSSLKPYIWHMQYLWDNSIYLHDKLQIVVYSIQKCWNGKKDIVASCLQETKLPHKEYQEAIGKILHLALWNCLISNIQVMKRLRTLKTICSPIFLIDIIHMEAQLIN